MDKIEAPDNIVRSTSQKMSDIRDRVSGSKKRFEALTVGLLSDWRNAFQGKFTHVQLVNYFNRKLKRAEGYIIDYNLYAKFFGRHPSELDVADLQHLFGKEGITIAPLYRQLENKHVAVFIIVHRNAFEAINASNDMREVITGDRKNKVNMAFIRAALIVSEELGAVIEKNNAVTKQDVCNSLAFSDDDVYLVSMNFCMAYRIDPKQLGDLLESEGFRVSFLKKDQQGEETIEAYKFYENMIGLVVSKTDAGIQLAHENLDLLFRVCEVTEEGLPKAVESVVGVNGVV